MSKKTVSNEYPYRGLVESRAIPAELHVRADGRPYASFGTVTPVHCCSPEQVKEYVAKTHHYCDVFTEEILSPLGELAYVRLDENTAEKVFINRTKRILIMSSDGELAQWRAAPSFESTNHYLAGAPIVNKEGALVSVVTARKGNHYAVSTFEGDGGYFETPREWTVIQTPEGHLVYGDRTFATRDELRGYIASLPPAELSQSAPPKPVMQYLKHGSAARLALVASNGRQISHLALQNVVVSGVEYL
ncbi:hypothetical protein O0L34_g14192 [Tuta absoluta]|nr:hypothetical protein O0L34_g14192 [Tuta absoluta]